MRARIKKVVSGAQTGVDRAALDSAIGQNIAVGGWVPNGRLAEDGRIPETYSFLTETKTQNYSERTALNVRDSDATLIISFGGLSGGSLLTKQMAERYGRPVLHLDLDSLKPDQALDLANEWIESSGCGVLNVAGPRASSNPKIYRCAKDFLGKLFGNDEKLT